MTMMVYIAALHTWQHQTFANLHQWTCWNNIFRSLMNQIEIVNIEWKGVICTTLHLNELCQLVTTLPIVNNAVYQKCQPKQLIIKFLDASTMIMFKTGKFRIMGKCLSRDIACYNASCVTRLVHDCAPLIDLQTMTVVYTHAHHLNLTLLSRLVQGSEHKTQCHYDAEHFLAVQIISFKPIHVNVFTSGKVIICGVKNNNSVDTIPSQLVPTLLLASCTCS